MEGIASIDLFVRFRDIIVQPILVGYTIDTHESEFSEATGSAIRGHSEIMFGVPVVVLGRDPITCLEFSLGQSHVPIVASSRVVRTLWL
jgi:hypothetical protein